MRYMLGGWRGGLLGDGRGLRVDEWPGGCMCALRKGEGPRQA